LEPRIQVHPNGASELRSVTLRVPHTIRPCGLQGFRGSTLPREEARSEATAREPETQSAQEHSAQCERINLGR
jgi:hypothetical protein